RVSCFKRASTASRASSARSYSAWAFASLTAWRARRRSTRIVSSSLTRGSAHGMEFFPDGRQEHHKGEGRDGLGPVPFRLRARRERPVGHEADDRLGGGLLVRPL